MGRAMRARRCRTIQEVRLSLIEPLDEAEPALTSRVYNTDDLIVSFDVVNVQWPNHIDPPANKPWAHQDQVGRSLNLLLHID